MLRQTDNPSEFPFRGINRDDPPGAPLLLADRAHASRCKLPVAVRRRLLPYCSEKVAEGLNYIFHDSPPRIYDLFAGSIVPH
ncbi:MAG: hypothetical protein ACK41Q_10680 [Candidatus Brocadia sp.]